MIVTDTIPLPPGAEAARIKVLSVAPLFGEAIKRIHRGESVGALFTSEVENTSNLTFWKDDGDTSERPAVLAGAAATPIET